MPASDALRVCREVALERREVFGKIVIHPDE